MEQHLVSLLNSSFGHGSSAPGPSRPRKRASSCDSLFSATSEPAKPAMPAIEPKKNLKRKRLSHIEVPSRPKDSYRPSRPTRQFSKYDPKAEQTTLSLGFAPWTADDDKNDEEYAQYCEDAKWLTLQQRGISYKRNRKTQPRPPLKEDYLKWRSDIRGWDLPVEEYREEDKSTTASACCGWDGLMEIQNEAKTKRKLVPTVLVDKPKAKRKPKTNPVKPQPLYLNGKRLSKPSYPGISNTPIVIDHSDDSDYGPPSRRKKKNKKSTPKYRRVFPPSDDDDDYSDHSPPPPPPKRSLSKSRPTPRYRPSSIVPETSPEPSEPEEAFETQLSFTMNLANSGGPASTSHMTPKSASPQMTLDEHVSDSSSSSATHDARPPLPIHTIVPPTSSHSPALQEQEQHHPVRVSSSSIPSVYSKAAYNSSFYQSFQPQSSPLGSPYNSPQRAQSQPSPSHFPMPYTTARPVPRSLSLPVPVDLASSSDNLVPVQVLDWADLAPDFAKRTFPSLDLPSHPSQPTSTDQPLNISQFVHLSPQSDEAQVDHFPPTDNPWSLEGAAPEEHGAGNGTINPVLLQMPQSTPRAPTLSPQAPFNLDLDDTNPSGPRHFKELFGDDEFGEGLVDPDHEPTFSSRSAHLSLYNPDQDYPVNETSPVQPLPMKFGKPKSKPKLNGRTVARKDADEIAPVVKVKYSVHRQTTADEDDDHEQFFAVAINGKAKGKGNGNAKGRDKSNQRSPAFIKIQPHPGVVDDDDKDEHYHEGSLPKSKGKSKGKAKGKAKPRSARQSDGEYQDEPLPSDDEYHDLPPLPNITGRSKVIKKGKAKDHHDDDEFPETSALPAKRAPKPSARLLEIQQNGVEEPISPRRIPVLKIRIPKAKENGKGEEPRHADVHSPPVDGAEAETVPQPFDKPSTSTNFEENQAPSRPTAFKTGFPTRRQEWPVGEEAYFCHPCRNRSNRLHMVCAMENCNKTFCQRCITIRFPLYEFDHTQTDWACFCCTDECTCDVCTRRRGEIYVPLRPGDAPSSFQPPRKTTRVTQHNFAAPAARRTSRVVPVEEAPAFVFRDVLEPVRPWAVVYGVDDAKLIGEAFTDGADDVVLFKGDLTKLVRAATPIPELPPPRPRPSKLKRKRSTPSSEDYDTNSEPDEEPEPEKRRKVRVYVGYLAPSSKWQVVEGGEEVKDIDDPRPRPDPDDVADDEEEQGPFVKPAYGMRKPGVISYTGKVIRWYIGNRKTLDWKCPSLEVEDELCDEDAEGETEDGDVPMLDPPAEVQHPEPTPLSIPMPEFDGPLSPLTVSGGEYCGRYLVDGKPDVSPKMNQETTSLALTTMTDLAKAPDLGVDQATLINVISQSLFSVGTTPMLVGVVL